MNRQSAERPEEQKSAECAAPMSSPLVWPRHAVSALAQPSLANCVDWVSGTKIISQLPGATEEGNETLEKKEAPALMACKESGVREPERVPRDNDKSEGNRNMYFRGDNNENDNAEDNLFGDDESEIIRPREIESDDSASESEKNLSFNEENSEEFIKPPELLEEDEEDGETISANQNKLGASISRYD